MAKSVSKQPRPWEIKDIYNRIAAVRAVPILFLEKWEREKGLPGADCMTTDEINNELVTRGILQKPMVKQGAGNLIASFCQKQSKRNLFPALVEPIDKGKWRCNISKYESLLREFRERYPLVRTDSSTMHSQQRSDNGKRLDLQVQSLEKALVQAAREYEKTCQDRIQELENQLMSLGRGVTDVELKKRVEPLLVVRSISNLT